MTDFKINSNWNEALKLCMQVAELNEEDQYRHIISLDITEEIKSKALKIINRLDEKNTLLDDSACSVFIKSIEDDHDLVGLKIDNYQLINRIAKGGMSSIYEGIVIDSEVQNHVAIKVLSPQMYSEKSLELFKREQVILSKLKHPSIVSFHHSGIGPDGMQYLVMEFIEGARTIFQFCEDKKLSTKAIVKLTKELADVCTYAHNNLIIHRDIKADNVLVDSQGRVKLIDFGIGQYDSEDKHEFTQVFTLGSASPEQLLGKNVTVQTDVFSLGALLLNLLVKQKPLPKTNIGQYDPNEDQKHINQLLSNSELDSDLQNIIHRAMHIDIEQRYKNMAEFSQDLDNWQKNKPVLATPDSFYYRLKKFYKRNKLSTFLALTVLTIMIVSGTLLYHSEANRQSERAKKEQSLEIIRSVFKQANPLNKQFDESTLTSGFENIKLEQKALLEADPELKHLIYSEMAELYYSNNFYSKAIENQKQALNILSQFASKDDLIHHHSVAQLAVYLSAGGEYQESKELAHDLISKLKPDNIKHIRTLVLTHLTLASSHYILTEVKQAKYYLNLAFKIMNSGENSTEIDQVLKADMISLKGIILRSEGQIEEASIAYQQAIDFLRTNESAKKDLALYLTNYAVLKADEDEFEHAEQLFLEAKHVIEALDESHTQIAVINIQYSNLLRRLERYDEAEGLLNKSLPILENANDKRQLVWIYRELAGFKLHNNQIEAALINIEKGYHLSREIYGIEHPQTLGLLNKIIGLVSLIPESIGLDMLFANIEKIHTKNLKQTIQYEDYQILKALFQKQKVINAFQLSQITDYMFGSAIETDSQREQWLLNAIQNSQTDPIVKTFSQLWLQSYKPNEKKYYEACSDINHWGFTYIYPLKHQLMDLCLRTAQQQGFEPIEGLSQSAQHILNQVKQSQSWIERFISNLVLEINPV